MADAPGGRQEVSGDELRFLADKAGQASVDVAGVRDRVQELVNGLDRRGWNAGAFDDQWARARFGLTELSGRFADHHTELLTRAAEADLLNTRYAAPMEPASADPPEGLAGLLDGLGSLLPSLPTPTLDPNGPIARQARGETINPLDWANELAGYEAQMVLEGAPAEVRNAQVTVTIPGLGQQTVSTQALVAMAMNPAMIVGGPEDAAGVEAVERAIPYLEGPARSAAQRLLEDWVAKLTTVGTPATTARNLFERAQTGPLNYLIEGDGKQVWADGVRVVDAHLLEAKYVATPVNSPYIADSLCPWYVREAAQKQAENEFERYAAVLGDANTPVKALEVIVNDDRAVPFFQALLDKYHVPGQVVVRPWPGGP
jgi:hypothetical protein